MSKVGSNVAWLLAGKGVGALLSIVYLGMATRVLGPAGFGQFALIFGLAQTITGIVSFQSWRLVVLYGHGARADKGRHDPALPAGLADVDAIAGFGFKLDLLAAVAGCVLAGVGVHFLAGPVGWNEALTRTALVFAVVMLLSVRSTAIGILRLYDRFRDGAAADAVMPVTRMIGAALAMVFVPTVSGFLVAWAASEVTTALAYWWMVHRKTPVRLTLRGGPSMRDIIARNPGIVRFALVTNAGSTLSSISQNLPLLAVGAFAGAAHAGLYRLANQLAQALMRVADMLSRAIYPELAKVRAHSGHDAAHALARRTTTIALAGGVIVVLLTLFAGKFAISVVAGPEFAGAYPLLVLLGIAVSIELAGVAFEPMLTASNRASRVLLIRLGSTLVLAATMAMLIPAQGVMGAAWATLAGSVVSLSLLWLAVRKSQ